MKRPLAPWLPIALLAALAAAASASNRITETIDPMDGVRNKLIKKTEPVGPAALGPAELDTLRAAAAKDQAETLEWLKGSPTSYLAAINRRDFGEQRTLTVGSATGNDVRIADSTVAAQHLRVTVVGDSFRVEAADPAATFRVRGNDERLAVLAPGSIGVGRYTLRLSHQRYPAIIVFDPQSPRFAEFKGLQWYPYDPAARFVAPLLPNPEPDTVEVLSTHSQPRQAVRAGWFVFQYGGKKCVLEATRLLEPGVGENDMSVFFRDKTTGKETYEVGRYVEPERLPDGKFVLDLNHAYNPACAISPYYNCPIPSRANTLKVEVKAGERDSKYKHK